MSGSSASGRVCLKVEELKEAREVDQGCCDSCALLIMLFVQPWEPAAADLEG